MKKKSFNFSKYTKTANYQDAGNLMKQQTRHYMDCYKAKLDAGMSAHEARESCIAEYQDPEKFNYFNKK